MTKPAEVDTSELDAMFPDPHPVTVGTVTINVPVLDYGQIARILKLIVPVLRDATTNTVQGLAMEFGEETGKMLAIALRKPPEYVEHMRPDLFTACLVKLYEINKDFFETHVLPRLPAWVLNQAKPDQSPAR